MALLLSCNAIFVLLTLNLYKIIKFSLTEVYVFKK